MISGSPRRYIEHGLAQGYPIAALNAAVTRSRPVEAAGLTAVLSLGHLAHQTGAHYGYLRAIVARRHDGYRAFEISRRRGRSPRYISSPQPILKSVQRWILDRIVGEVATSPISFAYQRYKSIRQCAEQHLNARWLVKLDLHDFFHSINERQVFEVFTSLGYAELPAFEMARITTRHRVWPFDHIEPTITLGELLDLDCDSSGLDDADETEMGQAKELDASDSTQRYVIADYSSTGLGFLPQGAPTSGALANLVSRDLDARLQLLADDTDTVVTRYADDITFSGTGTFSRSRALSLANRASCLIGKAGFEVHDAKTRIVTPGARKIVLGLLVNSDRVRLTKDFRQRLLRHVRGVETFGITTHQRTAKFDSAIGLVRHVRGLIDFAQDVDPLWTSEIRARWDAALLRGGLHVSELAD